MRINNRDDRQFKNSLCLRRNVIILPLQQIEAIFSSFVVVVVENSAVNVTLMQIVANVWNIHGISFAVLVHCFSALRSVVWKVFLPFSVFSEETIC